MGDLSEELLVRQLMVDGDASVRRVEHSGGEVVLRWYRGLAVGACSGGLA